MGDALLTMLKRCIEQKRNIIERIEKSEESERNVICSFSYSKAIELFARKSFTMQMTLIMIEKSIFERRL